jgi:hypothetical protein
VTRRTQLIVVAGICSATMFAVSAGAQAAPLWEVAPPWHVLPVNTVETLKSKGALALFEVGKTVAAKCKIVDSETIENVPNSGGAIEAIDVMTAFNGICFGAATFPCTAGEHFTLSGGKWPSRLVGAVEDEFLNSELEIHCLTSGLKEFYLGLSLHPALTVNRLTFSGVASGTLKAGVHEIYFAGIDKLKPVGFAKVR